MPMKPHKGETQSEFMSRCVPDMLDADLKQDQAVAACFSAWRAEHGGKKPKKEATVEDQNRIAKVKEILEKRNINKDIFDELDFPEPMVGENREDYVGRCTDEVGSDEASDKYSDADIADGCEATAEAFEWDENDEMVEDSYKPTVQKVDVPAPEEGETQDEYMSRCVSELQADDEELEDQDAEDFCTEMWQERSTDEWRRKNRVKQRGGVTTFKTHASRVNGTEFILSDETPDRMGDIIMAGGWRLDNFNKNPIALFNHRPDFPIGRWEKLRVDGNALRGHLILAPAGISDRIDEIRKLIQAGILKAVSVGFKPIKSEHINAEDPWGGKRFSEQELVETSLVSVPANPNALAVAKSLEISDDIMALVFDKSVKREGRRISRRSIGKPAVRRSIKERTPMDSPLGTRITDSQNRLTKLRDALTDHLKSVDDSNVSDTQLEVTNGFNAKIMQEEKGLATLREAEKHLAVTSQPLVDKAVVTREQPTATAMRRPFAVPGQKIQPQDYVWRTLVCQLKAHVTKKPILEVLKETYGEDEGTRTIMGVITKAAALPADTVTSGWASQLVETSIQDFMSALTPVSVFPKLAAKGGSFTFGRAGIISMPTRAPTPTIAGSFVAQGAPIPVRQAAFTAVTLTPKKMGVISTFTREISEHSTPAIEGLIRQSIIEDTAVAVDAVLLDANPATTVRPAGLRNGVAAITATAGGGLAGIIGDLRALTSAMVASTNGNLRSPVWLMNPGDVLAIALTPATAGGGEFPFKAELAGDSPTLLGYPVIASTNVAADMMILVDAADFISVTGNEPRFDVSDQATLHMEDTAPLQLATGAQGSGVVATPARSLWQTDTIGIRMLLDMNWAMRRTGTIAWTQTMTWN